MAEITAGEAAILDLVFQAQRERKPLRLSEEDTDQLAKVLEQLLGTDAVEMMGQVGDFARRLAAVGALPRRLSERRLEQLGELYRESPSPVHAFAALRLAGDLHEPAPAWVDDYLDRVCEHVQALYDGSTKVNSTELLQALEFTEGTRSRTALSQASRGERDARIRDFMKRAIERGRGATEAKGEIAAREGCSVRTVERAMNGR